MIVLQDLNLKYAQNQLMPLWTSLATNIRNFGTCVESWGKEEKEGANRRLDKRQNAGISRKYRLIVFGTMCAVSESFERVHHLCMMRMKLVLTCMY